MDYTKVCTVCQEAFPATNEYFNKAKLGKYGITAKCKKCLNNYLHKYYSKNKKRYAKNRKNNKLKKSEYDKQRYEQYKDKIKVRSNQYYYANYPKVKQYWQNRYKNDLDFRITMNLRKRVRDILKSRKKYLSTIQMIGCSSTELRIHLQKQFTDGMNWENYGFYGWHIDHIIPCSSFDMTDPEQQKICFHYSNLQPLWAADNFRKSDKVLDNEQ
jgi:hypothetical protein